MNQEIDIYFDDGIFGYVVRLPDLTTMKMLVKAKNDLTNLLLKNTHIDRFSLLLDTGKHEFESIACLKFLRSLLSIPLIAENCIKYASVAPVNYFPSEFISDQEASFNDFNEAYRWLNRN